MKMADKSASAAAAVVVAVVLMRSAVKMMLKTALMKKVRHKAKPLQQTLMLPMRAKLPQVVMMMKKAANAAAAAVAVVAVHAADVAKGMRQKMQLKTR
jgi:hypothetical protein